MLSDGRKIPGCVRFPIERGFMQPMKPILVMTLALVPLFLSSADGMPQLIAHRGASSHAPENTLASFRLAWKEGADGIEGDFYLSQDGEVVCIHDKTTKRTADTDLQVTESTLGQLRELDFGAWKGKQFQGERIPTLNEVLDVLPAGKWFFLEIKDSARIVKPIAKILKEKKADPAKVVLISFNKEVVKACREIMPAYRACLISELKEFGKEGQPDGYLAELKSTGAQGLLFKENAPVTAEWLKQVRGKDGLLMAWTVDDKKVARRMIGLGVDFVGTNRPGDLRVELKAE